jgi:hypothetical protein
VPDEDSPEVGGVQNTMTNLGASLGTALAGSVMIAAVTSSFLINIEKSPDISEAVSQQAQVSLVSGVPFVSDADLNKALKEAGVDDQTAAAAQTAYADARIDGLTQSLAILALVGVIALFVAQLVPTRQPSSAGP